MTLLSGIVLTVIPYRAAWRALGFRSPPLLYFLFLILRIALYMLLMTFLEKAYITTKSSNERRLRPPAQKPDGITRSLID